MTFKGLCLACTAAFLLVVSCEWESYVDPGDGTTRLTLLEVPGRYSTIQDAIDASLDGDTIMVASGTYSGDGNTDIRLSKKSILLKSEKGPDSTTIDCKGAGGLARRAFIVSRGEDSTTVIEGFTVLGGRATEESYHEGWGGAVYIEYSSPKFVNCVFRAGIAVYGGAVACRTCRAIFEDCVFILNAASVEGGGIKCEGGADPKLRNCLFQANQAQERGGAMNLVNASANVVGCSFIANSASDPGYGGAMFCLSASPFVQNSIFYQNSGEDGGAVYCRTDANPRFENCTMLNNNSSSNAEAGSGISCNSGAKPFIDYCLIVGGGPGPGISVSDTTNIPVITCSDLYSNSGGNWVGAIADQIEIRGNLSADPLFCGGSGDQNAKIEAASPCWPENNSCGEQIGAFVTSCDSL